MTNYGVGLQYHNALQDFEEHGYCVVRGMLSEDALRPVRERQPTHVVSCE